MKSNQLTRHGWILAAVCLVARIGVADEAATRVERVGKDIQYLASDELEGRGVQTEGIRKAARYIRDEFKKLGLKSGTKDGSYFQKFPVRLREQQNYEGSKLVITGPGGKKFELKAGKDWMPMRVGGMGKAKADLVFVGYGISGEKEKYDDYAGIDVEGKIVVMIRREPQQDKDDSVFSGKDVTMHSYLQTKFQVATAKKAAGLILVNDPFNTKKSKKDELNTGAAIGRTRSKVPFIHLKQEIVNKILADGKVVGGDKKLSNVEAVEAYIDETLKPVSAKLEGWTAEVETKISTKSVDAENVIGILEGEGPLKDETIVVGAHYDHLGYGGPGSRRRNSTEIHNGADDNATGTAAVMEIARRMVESGKKPSRRIVFIAFSGEERGLVGASYYVQNPVIPLDKTVAMFNYDMIGWLRNDELTIFGTNTAAEWKDLVAKTNEELKMKLKLPPSLAGSDHIPFARNKTPVFHFFSGFTDTYHTPEDDYKTINVEGCVKIIDFSEKLLNLTLAMKKPPTFVESNTRRRRPRLAYHGIVPDTGASGNKGIVVRTVAKDSPAEKAGIKAADRITKIGDSTLKAIPELFAALQGKRAGDTIKVTYVRGEETKTVEIKLGAPR